MENNQNKQSRASKIPQGVKKGIQNVALATSLLGYSALPVTIGGSAIATVMTANTAEAQTFPTGSKTPLDMYNPIPDQKKIPEVDTKINTIETKLQAIDQCMPILDGAGKAGKNCDLGEAEKLIGELSTLVSGLSEKDNQLYRDDVKRLMEMLGVLKIAHNNLKKVRENPFDTFATIKTEADLVGYVSRKQPDVLKDFSDDTVAAKRLLAQLIDQGKIKKKDQQPLQDVLGKLSGNALSLLRYEISALEGKDDEEVKGYLLTILNAEIDRKRIVSPVLLSPEYYIQKEGFEETINSIEDIQRKINDAIQAEIQTTLQIGLIKTEITKLENKLSSLRTSLTNQSNTSEKIVEINKDIIANQQSLYRLQGKEVEGTAVNNKQFVIDSETKTIMKSKDGQLFPLNEDDLASLPYGEASLARHEANKIQAQTRMNSVFDKSEATSMEGKMNQMNIFVQKTMDSYQTDVLQPQLEQKLGKVNKTKKTNEEIQKRALNEIDKAVNAHKLSVKNALETGTPVPAFDIFTIAEAKNSRKHASEEIRTAELSLYDERLLGLHQEYKTIVKQMQDFTPLLVRIGIMLNDGSSLPEFGLPLPAGFDASKATSLLDLGVMVANTYKETDQLRRGSPTAQQIALMQQGKKGYENHQGRIEATNSLQTSMLDYYKGLLYRQMRLAHEIRKTQAEKNIYDAESQYTLWQTTYAIETNEQLNYYTIIFDIEKKIGENKRIVEQIIKDNKEKGTRKIGTEDQQLQVITLTNQNATLESSKTMYLTELSNHTRLMIIKLADVTNAQRKMLDAERDLQQILDQIDKIESFEKNRASVLVGKVAKYDPKNMDKLESVSLVSSLAKTFPENYTNYNTATSQARKKAQQEAREKSNPPTDKK